MLAQRNHFAAQRRPRTENCILIAFLSIHRCIASHRRTGFPAIGILLSRPNFWACPSGASNRRLFDFGRLSPLTDVAVFRVLLADLHDDVQRKVARFHQLADLSAALGRLFG